MLTNARLIQFVNQVAADDQLRSALEADFEGTLRDRQLELAPNELASLKASYRYLRTINPLALEDRIAAGGGKAHC